MNTNWACYKPDNYRPFRDNIAASWPRLSAEKLFVYINIYMGNAKNHSVYNPGVIPWTTSGYLLRGENYNSINPLVFECWPQGSQYLS